MARLIDRLQLSGELQGFTQDFLSNFRTEDVGDSQYVLKPNKDRLLYWIDSKANKVEYQLIGLPTGDLGFEIDISDGVNTLEVWELTKKEAN